MILPYLCFDSDKPSLEVSATRCVKGTLVLELRHQSHICVLCFWQYLSVHKHIPTVDLIVPVVQINTKNSIVSSLLCISHPYSFSIFYT